MKRSTCIYDELSHIGSIRCRAAFSILPLSKELLGRDDWASAHLPQHHVLPKIFFSCKRFAEAYHLRGRKVNFSVSNTSRFAVLRAGLLLLIRCNPLHPFWKTDVNPDGLVIFFRRCELRRSCTRQFINSVAAAALSGCGA